METALANIRDLLPLVAIAWAIVLASAFWKPYRFRNSFYLFGALTLTAFLIAGIFGDAMATVLAVMACLAGAVVLFVPVFLIINGILMLRREGRSLPNLLSFALGIGLLVVLAALVLLTFASYDKGTMDVSGALLGFLTGTVLFFSLVFCAFVLYAVFIQRLPQRKACDFIIIHGCGLHNGRDVTPLLAGRIEKAIELFHRSGDAALLIASGGKGSDEAISEAEAIGAYLMAHGVPAEKIILEDRSSTTMENLANSQAIIQRFDIPKPRIILVSSNYHVYRCLIYARKLHMRCSGAGGRVAPYYWPSAVIREFVAVFTRRPLIIWLIVWYVIIVLGPSISVFAALL